MSAKPVDITTLAELSVRIMHAHQELFPNTPMRDIGAHVMLAVAMLYHAVYEDLELPEGFLNQLFGFDMASNIAMTLRDAMHADPVHDYVQAGLCRDKGSNDFLAAQIREAAAKKRLAETEPAGSA